MLAFSTILLLGKLHNEKAWESFLPKIVYRGKVLILMKLGISPLGKEGGRERQRGREGGEVGRERGGPIGVKRIIWVGCTPSFSQGIFLHLIRDHP